MRTKTTASSVGKVERDGARLRLSGVLSMDTVPALLDTARAACRSPGLESVDFSAVESLDSAAIALALELRRLCGPALKLENLPEAALNLASLYSVADQLGIESP